MYINLMNTRIRKDDETKTDNKPTKRMRKNYKLVFR